MEDNKKLNMEWLATLLFCLFLGVFGAHRFYNGKIQTAVTMLSISILLGWLLGLGFYITTIWTVVDLIMIVCGKFTDKNNNPILWTEEIVKQD